MGDHNASEAYGFVRITLRERRHQFEDYKDGHHAQARKAIDRMCHSVMVIEQWSISAPISLSGVKRTCPFVLHSLLLTQSGHQVSACTASKSYGVYAACFALASKRARAFFPSLAATAMLSKKSGELSSGPHRQAR